MKKLALALSILVVLLGGNVPTRAQQASGYDFWRTVQPASPHAIRQLTIALQASDYQGPPITLLKSYHVPNALATTRPRYRWTAWGWRVVGQERVVVYNPSFMTQLEFNSGNTFNGLSVLAHEVGHHHHNHVNNTPWSTFTHPWHRELEADGFAGKVLARLGARPADLAGVHRSMFSWWGSPSHPDSLRRIQAIARGYRAGGGQGNVELDLRRLWRQFSSQATRWHR